MFKITEIYMNYHKSIFLNILSIEKDIYSAVPAAVSYKYQLGQTG